MREKTNWTVIISPRCNKQLSNFPRDERENVLKSIKELEIYGILHRNVKKLEGRPEWSLRVGSRRVILRVDIRGKIIVTTMAGNRGDIFKK